MGNLDLEVQMGAKLTEFESGMDKAVSLAENAVNQIEQRFSSLNPSVGDGFGSAIGGGLIAGLTGALAFASRMNAELAEMERLAKQTGLSLERFQGVQFATALSGVNSDNFTSGLEKAVSLLNDAQRNENTLQQLFEANGVAIKNNNGQLITTNQLLGRSADLVQRAATEQDKIKIAQMLGFTREWVPVLEQGAQAFEKQSQEAERLGLIIDRSTIEKAAEFDREWKASAAFWSANIRAAAADILPSINELIDAASKIFTKENLTRLGRDGLALIEQAGVPKELNIAIPQGVLDFFEELRKGLRTELGIDIQIKTPQAVIDEAFRQIRTPDTLNAATDEGSGAGIPRAATPINVNKPRTVIPPKDTGSGSEGRDPFETSIASAERRIAVLNAETATIGLNSEARERARLVAILEEAAKRANTDAGLSNTAVTEEQRKQIDLLANSMESAAKRNREMQEAFNNYRELASAASEAFKGLVLEGKNFDEVLSRLLNRLAARAIDRLFDNLLLGGGSGGGLFGSLGAIFGGNRAAGGPVMPGNAYRVNERTPNSEWFVPGVPGNIVPNDVNRAPAAAPNISFGDTIINGSGLSEEQLERVISRSQQATLRAAMKMSPAAVADRQYRTG